MDVSFPVTHSKLSAEALLSDVVPDYDVGTPLGCRLLCSGFNDTYLVKTSDDLYVLRIYKAGWRSESEILYELDVLLHLSRRGVSVSRPLTRKEGGFIRALKAPEGLRYAALFTYAAGKEPGYSDEKNAHRYGRLVARLHAETEDFASPHNRPPLDLAHLIDEPLAALQPYLEHRPDDRAYLQRLTGRLRERIEAFPTGALDYGLCHGDLYGGNVHVSTDNTWTVFDFDCCGPGWRAYDLSVFRWHVSRTGQGREQWDAFLKGYTEQRPLGDSDLEAIPLFVAARHIWLQGLLMQRGENVGFGSMNDEYLNYALKFLRAWEARYPADGKPGTAQGSADTRRPYERLADLPRRYGRRLKAALQSTLRRA